MFLYVHCVLITLYITPYLTFVCGSKIIRLLASIQMLSNPSTKTLQMTTNLFLNPFTEASYVWWKHYRSKKALQSTAVNEKKGKVRSHWIHQGSTDFTTTEIEIVTQSVFLYNYTNCSQASERGQETLWLCLSERHTHLLSAVLSGTCRMPSLCPRSRTPADCHPSVTRSAYSSGLPGNISMC